MKKNIAVKEWEELIKSYAKNLHEERFEFLKTVHKKAKKNAVAFNFLNEKK